MYWPTLGVRAGLRAGACLGLALAGAAAACIRRIGCLAAACGAAVSGRENMFSMKDLSNSGSDVQEEANAVPPAGAAKSLKLRYLFGMGGAPEGARQILPGQPNAKRLVVRSIEVASASPARTSRSSGVLPLVG